MSVREVPEGQEERRKFSRRAHKGKRQERSGG